VQAFDELEHTELWRARVPAFDETLADVVLRRVSPPAGWLARARSEGLEAKDDEPACVEAVFRACIAAVRRRAAADDARQARAARQLARAFVIDGVPPGRAATAAGRAWLALYH
jgi:hypothetical protein